MAEPKKPKSLPIVLVDWIDASALEAGWEVREKQAAINPGLAYTVGLLLRKDRTAIVVACTYDPLNDTVVGGMTIPRVWVKKIKRLGTWRAK